jgi:hypothetical protein
MDHNLCQTSTTGLNVLYLESIKNSQLNESLFSEERISFLNSKTRFESVRSGRLGKGRRMRLNTLIYYSKQQQKYLGKSFHSEELGLRPGRSSVDSSACTSFPAMNMVKLSCKEH